MKMVSNMRNLSWMNSRLRLLRSLLGNDPFAFVAHVPHVVIDTVLDLSSDTRGSHPQLDFVPVVNYLLDGGGNVLGIVLKIISRVKVRLKSRLHLLIQLVEEAAEHARLFRHGIFSLALLESVLDHLLIVVLEGLDELGV